MSLARVTLFPAIAALLAAGALVACEQSSVEEAFTVEGSFHEVRIHLEEGELELSAHPRDALWVERSLSGPTGGFELETRVEDGVLTMDMHCAVPHTCRIDARIQVPEGVPVRVELEDGALNLPGRSLGPGGYEFAGIDALPR